MSNTTVLLLGGGYVLNRLARELEPGSFVITSRSEDTCQSFEQEGMNAWQLDQSDKQQIEQLFERYPGIATVIDSVPPSRDSDDPLMGTRNTIEVAEEQNVKRIFYLSTTGVYGVSDGRWVDEETPCHPISPQGQLRFDVEELYRRSQIATTSFRLSGIYGPGRGIGLSLKAGTYRQLEDGTRYTNRIHVDDIVQSLLKALSFEGDLPESFNVNDDDPAPMSDVIQHYVKTFQLPEPSIISKEEAEKSGKRRLLQNQRIKNQLLKETLNIRLRYPTYREGAGTEFAQSST